MESTAGTASTHVQGRSSAMANSSSGGAGAAEGFAYTSPASQYDGLVLINTSGSGGYTLYRDTTAPTGDSVSINNGDASTQSQSVNLALSAADSQTGLMDMRISTDGAFDSESWQPYSTSATATLPAGNGTKTVDVQFRNNAGAISQGTDTIELAQAVPGKPAVTGETASPGSVSVAFSAPSSDGGSAITSYTAQCVSTDGGVSVSKVGGTTSPILIQGLTGAKHYQCRVKATNAIGTGAYSSYGAVVLVPAAVAPGKPTVTGETPASGAVSVAFSAPSSNGGSPITSYTAQCISTNGGVSVSKIGGTTSPINITGLSGGRAYQCRVKATNAAGTGLYSSLGGGDGGQHHAWQADGDW